MPWNPAVLEQRIARIHRMGQKRPVRIVNFVAKGTIEEGMLSVLAFKRSLSAGILDGGVGEISLGGSRLSRFMKDVENVTGRMGEGEAITPAEEAGCVPDSPVAAPAPDSLDAPRNEGERTTAAAASEAPEPPTSPIGTNPWEALVQVGAQLVGALAAANDPGRPAHPWVERDPAGGASALKIPLPPPETARRLADALSELANALKGWSS